MTRRPDIPLPQIVRGLAARIDALCGELLANGVREGTEWCVGSLAGEAGRSCKVHLAGPRAGVWADFSSGEAGDALDLVAAVLFAGDKGKALRWSLSWLGLDGGDPGRLAETRRALAAQPPAGQGADQAAARARLAQRLFLASAASIQGTPADRYLKGRGLDLAPLRRQPACLRFHPSLSHRETWDRERRSGPTYPGLVASIVAADGSFAAIHRTYLEHAGGGAWRKLSSVRDAKLTLGTYRGGLIRLWRGRRGDGRAGYSWRDMPAGSAVTITEGIEDGLSVVLADPGRRVVVGVSLANMLAVDWPAAVQAVTIVGQNDAPGSPAAELLDRVIAAYQDQGKQVLLAMPPAGFKDVAEQAQAQLRHGGGGAA